MSNLARKYTGSTIFTACIVYTRFSADIFTHIALEKYLGATRWPRYNGVAVYLLFFTCNYLPLQLKTYYYPLTMAAPTPAVIITTTMYINQFEQAYWIFKMIIEKEWTFNWVDLLQLHSSFLSFHFFHTHNFYFKLQVKVIKNSLN